MNKGLLTESAARKVVQHFLYYGGFYKFPPSKGFMIEG